MEKQITTLIDRFDGGLSKDKRSKSSNKFALTKHFDTMTYPHKLVPYRSTEADEVKASNIVNFLYAPYNAGASHYLYGLGIASTTKAKVYVYNIDSGLDSTWTTVYTAAKSESTLTNRNTEVFFYYKDYIYMFGNSGRYLIRFHNTGVDDFNDSYQDMGAAGTVAQPVHHPADDIAYFFSDNVVHKLNNVTWTGDALTLPSNLKINAACAWGDYLAIACVTKGTAEKQSIVYLWDRDSSLATLTSIIDFGKGEIIHLANLDNKLIAVMGYQITGNGALARGKILIKQAIGEFGIQLNELLLDTGGSSQTLPKVRSLQDNKLYFVAKPQLNGDTRHGIWVVDSLGRLALDFVEEEVIVTGNYNGIAKVGNAWFISHSDDGSVNRSNDQEVYTYTSIYESLINGSNRELTSYLTKKLIGVRVTTEPLVANDNLSFILKYRKDEDIRAGSWTTILTRTTANANEINHEAINIESSGANLPEFKEIQFRIEVKSGSTAPSITSLEFISEFKDNNKF